MSEELARRVADLEGQLEQLRRTIRMLQDASEGDRRRQLYQMFNLNEEHLTPEFVTNLRYYKNMVYNSSFEMPGPGRTPAFWDTAGVCSDEAEFYGSCSLKLTPGQTATQLEDAWINPAFFGRRKARVSFAQKFGRVRCEVYSKAGDVLAYKVFDYAEDWDSGRRSFLVDPGGTERIYVKFTNIDTINDLYVDGVMLEPNRGKFPSIYTDGPYSGEYASEAQNFIGARVARWINQTIPNAAWTPLEFNLERWDDDNMAYLAVEPPPAPTTAYPTRLTIRTAGKYLIWGNVSFQSDGFGTGTRGVRIQLNGENTIGQVEVPFKPKPKVPTFAVNVTVEGTDSVGGPISATATATVDPAPPFDVEEQAMTDPTTLVVSTIYDLAVDDYVELEVYQSSGAVMTVTGSATGTGEYSLEFAAARVLYQFP